MELFTEQQWHGIEVRALTAIRRDWPVAKLEEMARSATPTPVCGDTLRTER